jgi:hypothetical protein
VPKQPEQGVTSLMSPVLKAACEEQLRDIEQFTNKEMLADMHYRSTLWLSALMATARPMPLSAPVTNAILLVMRPNPL